MAAVVINACTQIGQNVIINTGSIIEHDCDIRDHVHIASGAVLAGGIDGPASCFKIQDSKGTIGFISGRTSVF